MGEYFSSFGFGFGLRADEAKAEISLNISDLNYHRLWAGSWKFARICGVVQTFVCQTEKELVGECQSGKVVKEKPGEIQHVLSTAAASSGHIYTYIRIWFGFLVALAVQ